MIELTIADGIARVTLNAPERRNALGMGYVQARANFRSAQAPCTVYVVTRELHATPEAAEDEILKIARRQGWGIA